MNKNEMMNKISGAFGKAAFQLKKHSPEILIVAGVVSTVASAVMACRATTKLGAVLEDSKSDINEIHDRMNNEDASQRNPSDDTRKDLAVAYFHTGLSLVKLYAPAVALGTLSITGIVASNHILRKRNVALAAAYAAVDKGFKKYRSNVVDRFGEAVDRELKYNIKSKEFEETVLGENGKEKKIKKDVEIADPNVCSDYARFFDESCAAWEKDSEYNLMFLRSQQQYANDLLHSRGHLYLNEVYDMLGIQRTKAGQVVGWVYNPEHPVGDNYVDFGIYDVNREKNRDFVNGYERSILLDFNVDGNILDLMQ